jgi:hypothetical protein
VRDPSSFDDLSVRGFTVVTLMRDPEVISQYGVYGRDYSDDGEWFAVAAIPNVGRKTIEELLGARVIEAKRGPGNMYWKYLYRLVNAPEDFGDLWVE